MLAVAGLPAQRLSMPRAFVNGVNISYEMEGQGDPLFLIMGFAGTRRAWIFQRMALKRHHQVISFDNRGIGDSDKPCEPYSTKTMADDTLGLMHHLGIHSAHMLGVSMGGMIAQEIAIGHPERVRKLVLGCTFARSDETGGHTAEYYRRLGHPQAKSDVELKGVHPWKVLATDFSLAFNNRLYELIVPPLAHIYARFTTTEGLARQYEALLGHDALDRLHLIQSPTLVITGTEDRVIRPASSDVLAKEIPNARLVRVEGGSHAFFVAMKSRFNREVLDFLRED
jgi:3-oxoadipate enol-lactonase